MKETAVKASRNPLTRKIGGGKRKNRDSRRELRRSRALIRQEAYDGLSLDEKLAQAKERGGIHCKEYRRLSAALPNKEATG